MMGIGRSSVVFTTFLLLGAVACGGGGSDPAPGAAAQNLRPVGSPDVVVFSVSGHAPGLSALTCDSDDNEPYLGDPGAAREIIEQAFEDLGHTVESLDFADRLFSFDVNNSGDLDDGDYLGFEELLRAMELVFQASMDGYDNPTRIVLVGHSHGASWAHLATAAVPHIPVDCLISLDGICLQWECEHAIGIADFQASSGLTPLIDLGDPCDSIAVAGTTKLFNIKDVVFNHVRSNIEVQSSSLFVSDCCNNVRLDGTSKRIATFSAPEDHGGVREPGSASMAWVVDQIRQIDAAR